MIRTSAPPVVMTVAESDPAGASGVQADLKTFAALGVYGTSAITAITLRDLVGVVDVRDLPAALVASQIDAVLSDLGAAVVKTGMLPLRETVEAVAGRIRERGIENLVLDPVLAHADTLAEDEDVESLRTELVPLARVVTPNAREAGLLTGREVETLDDARTAASALVEMGADFAVVTGGRLPARRPTSCTTVQSSGRSRRSGSRPPTTAAWARRSRPPSRPGWPTGWRSATPCRRQRST